jgi:agmatinase
MSHHELFVSPSSVFSGVQTEFVEAEYVVLGVPLDLTSTYRSGARFAPTAIREASLNIETYSFRTGTDMEDLKSHDLGDLHVTGNVQETLRRLELVARDLLKMGKTPVVVGGEHTLTLGMMQAVNGNSALVSFDAHLDLRNQYMDLAVSHATFMRRIREQVNPKNILEIGTRAVCKEELDYAEKSGIQSITAKEIRENGTSETMGVVKDLLKDCEKTYVTVDMDVLDPAYAPAVQNPEPDGLSVPVFLDVLCGVCDERVIALDLVEVTPHYDQGVTAVQAAKTLFEALCHIEKARRQ